MNKIKWLLPTVLVISLAFSGVARAGVDDFYFESMHVDYQLSKDAEGRARLQVSETLKPVFPDFDQNRGIVRMIPLAYDNHKLNFKLESVARDGEPANLYKNEAAAGHQKLMIRDRSDSSYQHGLHTYNINYSLQDVTHKPKDAEIDEFYWDVNGNEWGQKFESVSATIKFSDDVFDKIMDNRLACYTGKFGGTGQQCTIKLDKEKRSLLVYTNRPLMPKETLTLAVGFEKNTFTPYQATIYDQLLDNFGVIAASLSTLSVLASLIRSRQMKPNVKVKKPIVTQFIPPEEAEIYTSANIINYTKLVSAALIDLAVKHKIKIIESSGSGLFNRKTFSIEIINSRSLTSQDREFLKIFFENNKLSDGLSYKFTNYDYRLPVSLRIYEQNQKDRLSNGSIYQSSDKAKKQAARRAILALIINLSGIFGVINTFGSRGTEAGMGIAQLPIVILSISISAAVLAFVLQRRLTEKGAELKGYLLGLENYIKAAETERLKFAQSVETAERQLEQKLKQDSTLGDQPNYKIILYERLLPYAILFGLEKSWSKQLEKLYQAEPDYAPVWYMGDGPFRASSFSRSLSSFSSATSSASSSSSGSGGGGSAGGGGGGGGGGGC